MNEPALTDPSSPARHSAWCTMPDSALHWPDGPSGKPLRHEAFHNAYGMQMARATFEGRRGASGDTLRALALRLRGHSTLRHLDRRQSQQWAICGWRAHVPGAGAIGSAIRRLRHRWLLARRHRRAAVRFTQLGAVFPSSATTPPGARQQEPWESGYTSRR
jgi:hypothetical protein